jgi:hypothetical protein
MDWSTLPYDVRDTILGKLPLHELVKLSPLCQRLPQLFRRKLAEEQEACCELAISRFGKGRVARIANIAHRLATGQPLDPDSGEIADPARVDFLISEDGTLHLVDSMRVFSALAHPHNCRDVVVWVIFLGGSDRSLIISISVGGGPRLVLRSEEDARECTLSLQDCRDEERDACGVALVHALVSGQFGAIVGENWPLPAVHIKWGDYKDGCTIAGLEAQIGPLAPLALSYKLTEPALGAWELVKVRGEDGQATSGAKRVSSLEVTH